MDKMQINHNLTNQNAGERRLGGRELELPPQKRYRPGEEPPKEWPLWALLMRAEYERQLKEVRDKLAEYEGAIMQQDQAQRHLKDQTALALYGGAGNIEALQQQVSISPKFADLTSKEHEYVARLALLTGLNPEFHLHAWKSSKNVKEGGKWVTKQVLNICPDYKALILKANSDRRIMLKDRRLTAGEMKERGIPESDIEEGAIGWVVECYDLQDAIMVGQAKQAGVLMPDYEPLRGYGLWLAKKDEIKWDKHQDKMLPTGKRIDNDVANGRDGAWMSWKRALRALLNQIADMSLQYAPLAGATPQPQITADGDWQFDGDVVEGTFNDIETPPAGLAVNPSESGPAVETEMVPTDELAALATEAEIMAMVKAFAEEHVLTVPSAEKKVAALCGLTTMKNYRGTPKALNLQLVSWRPDAPETDAVKEPKADEPVEVESPSGQVAELATDRPATQEEITALCMEFAEKHDMTLAESRTISRKLFKLTSMYSFTGSPAALKAAQDAWKPKAEQVPISNSNQ